MAIRVTIAGVAYEADTPAEIVELQQLLTGQQQGRTGASELAKPAAKAPGPPIREPANGTPDYRAFMNGLNVNGRTVMAEIVRNAPEAIGTEKLAEATKLQTMSLPPIFKHIRTVATKARIVPDRLFMALLPKSGKE